MTNHSYLLFTVCLNFKTARFNSIVVSESVTFGSSSNKSAINSLVRCISVFCCASSAVGNCKTVLDNPLILAKASTIAIVVCVALLLFRIVLPTCKVLFQ